MDSTIIIIGFLALLILLTFWFLIVKFIANFQLNRLRRKYNAEEDISRREELREFSVGPRADRHLDSPKQYLEGDDEPERRSILQDEPYLDAREDKPRTRELKQEPRKDTRSIGRDKQSNTKTNEALRRRFGIK